MASIHTSIDELIGNTPLLELTNIERNDKLEAKIIAKVELFNVAGSSKDRIARYILDEAEKDGLLTKESTIIEPTSGNTGIALCALAAARGYKIILTMPENMSIERRKLAQAYGAEVVLTDASRGMTGAIEKADELAKTIDSSFIPSQFTNQNNPFAHYKTTGPEIWKDTQGKVDVFIAGVGTGGTLTGVGRYLKEQSDEIKIVAVEPKTSPVLSEGKSGSHEIEGIGAGFIPETLDTEIYDEVIDIDNNDAIDTAKRIAKEEGLLVGISSGAALSAAIQVAKRPENNGKNIVVLFPDTGERYLSTKLFEF